MSQLKTVNQLKRRLVYGVMAPILMLGVFVLVPSPVVSGECECTGGYDYTAGAENCVAGGTNCAVCTCPPAK